MPRNTVQSPTAGTAGPYSHGVWSGDLFYLSGQAGVDPATGRLISSEIETQTRQCFHNLFGILEAAGLNSGHVVKVNVYLTDMADFAAMNSVYATQFEKPYPARTTIGVASLPLGARVEIEMIARRE